MGIVGQSVAVTGEIRSLEDLTVDGRVDGSITCDDAAVVISAAATVVGDIVARDVTIFGRVEGQIIATDVVDVRTGAVVAGQVVSRHFILNDGGCFTGRVEPQHLEAALRVAKFQQRKRDTA